MIPSLSRPRRGAVALAVLASAAAGCAAPAAAPGAPAAPAAPESAGIVLVTPNPVGGNNFLQLAVDAAGTAAAQAGAELQVFESTDPTSIQQNVEAAVREAPAVVVGVSFQLEDVFSTVPVDNPDQQFLLVDGCPDPRPANVTCARFREHEAAYLAGVEAGLLTESGSIGVVAALDSPFIRRWVDSFALGAASVNPGVTSTPLFVGGDNPFGDPARGAAQAQVLADSGADQVLAAASGSNAGVFEVAGRGGFQVFGVDVNECPSTPGRVVDNVLKKVDVALGGAVADVLAGRGGGDLVFGLAEDGVGVTALEPDVASSQCLVADRPDVIARVQEVRQGIVDGTITVPDPVTGG